MMKAIDCLNELKAEYRNTDIDWEQILEFGYRTFLSKESHVIDIGGHAARHSHVFCHEIGCAKLAIFEPLPTHATALQERYSNDAHVTVHECAMGAKAGTAEFVFNTNSPEESGLRERRYNNPGIANLEKFQVEVATLDEFCVGFERLDFVKIDTEGSEVDILVGGEATIRRLRPLLSIEYGAAAYEAYGKQRGTLFDLMEAYDYSLFDLFGNALDSRDMWEECVDKYYWDYFAAPREQETSFPALLTGLRSKVEGALIARA